MNEPIPYSGQVTDGGVREGIGKFNYSIPGLHPIGIYQYDGPFKSGKKHTESESISDSDKKVGKLIISGISTYIGEFKNGEIEGKGIKKWEDGREYSGIFHLGEMHGKGKYVSSNGNEIYEGDFISNKRNGKGTLTTKNIIDSSSSSSSSSSGSSSSSTSIYNGDFFNNKQHGKGSYLLENDFIFEGTFDDNIISGAGQIKWDKRSSLNGNFINGVPNNICYYSTNNKSYEYNGKFENGKILKGYATHMKCNIKNNENDNGGGSKGGKKDKGKKVSTPAEEAAIEIRPGDELGNIEILTTHVGKSEINEEEDGGNATTAEEVDIDWDVIKEIHLPLPCEMTRNIIVKLLPILENQSNDNEDDEKAVESQPLPINIKRPLIQNAVSNRDRWPALMLRYSGLNNTNTATNNDDEELVKDIGLGVDSEAPTELVQEGEINAASIDGLLCAQVTNSSSSVSFHVPHQDVRGAANALSFIMDFKIDIVSILKCYRSLITEINNNNTSTSTSSSVSIPIMTLNRRVDDLEGKSYLILDLCIPTSCTGVNNILSHLEGLEQQQQTEGEAGDVGDEGAKLADLDAFSNASLEGCQWNLRLYTKAAPSPVVDADAGVTVTSDGKESEGEVKVEVEVEGEVKIAEESNLQIEGDEQTEEEIVVKEDVIDSGICATWLEKTSFETGKWHSIGLSIRAEGKIDLIVDGTNRVLVDSDSDLGLGTVSAWLPTPTPETVAETSETKDGDENVTPEAEGVPEGEMSTPSKVELVVKSGNTIIETNSNSTTTTIGFVGGIASFGLCRLWDYCDLNNVCSIFSDETSYSPVLMTVEGEGNPPPTAVVDEVLETVIVCRCGKGTSSTIVIPESTPPGNYYLEVSDGVLSSCLSPPGSDTQPVTPGCSPVDLRNLCSWIPQLTTASNIKITVTPLE